jgi:hypothetical protein
MAGDVAMDRGRRRTAAVGVLVVSTAAIGALSRAEPAGPAVPQFDRADPKSWRPNVKDELKKLDQMAQELIAVAEDKERSDEDRLEAIRVLGMIGHSRCIDFLAANITMRIKVHQEIRGDGERFLGFPCLYALCGFDHGRNWNAVPEVMREVTRDGELTDGEIWAYALVLKEVCGKWMANAIVDDRLSRAGTDEQLKKNLIAVKGRL